MPYGAYMKRVIASFARNTVFANILLVLIFLVGGFAIKNKRYITCIIRTL